MLHNVYRVTKNWYRQDNKNVTYPRGTVLFRGEIIDPENPDNSGRSILVDQKEEFVCMVHSENAHYFCVGDDDGKWAERDDKISNIKALCGYGQNVALLYESKMCDKYNWKSGTSEPLLWNEEFYCAPLADLDVILNVLQLGYIAPEDRMVLTRPELLDPDWDPRPYDCRPHIFIMGTGYGRR